MGLYRIVLRPFLFALEAERAHRVTLAACETFGHNALVQRALARRFALEYPQLAIDIAGLHFKTPVGLAAGFDKNGVAVAVTSRLGFGFVEVGSVSLHPSAGNVGRPRVWRLTADNGLRVHYGCPNDGVQAIANRLSGYDHRVPLGINLVETNTGHIASAEHAADELATLIGRCANLADYLVLNLSCPNMPGGKGLFDMSAQLQNLLRACARNASMPPLFLKINPPGDPCDARIIDPILEAADPFAFVKGFILNVPNTRPYETLHTPRAQLDSMRGGITGPSLLEPTRAALSAWYSRIDRKRHVLAGVGGIASAQDAYALLGAGASVVQLYTALVYQGPGLVRRINEGLCRLLDRDGFKNIGESVGTSAPAR